MLPEGNDAYLKLLAAGVKGSQPNQTFIVTYTDGSTSTFTQSVSDWAVPQSNAGESTALSTAYRDKANGTTQSGAYNVYEYSFPLFVSRSVVSITLPNDANLELLAATLVPAGTSPINLSSAYNKLGIVADGTTFSGGGLDGTGHVYSASQLPTTVTAGGATFNLGPVGANDVVNATGQTIALPSGSYAALDLLATSVNTSQPNQTFTVTYSDGTTSTFTQSISDWFVPQGYAGESTGISTQYRDISNGSKQAGQFNVYEYSFTLDTTKTVASITLPNDTHVDLLAATLIPAGTTQVDLLSAYNRAGIQVDGTPFSGGGLDGDGYASTYRIGTTLNTGGSIFNFGPAAINDVVSATGQTIALPSGRYSSLKLLATGVNGSQPNQTFIVTYTDGTTATFTQSLSDWAIPQSYPGETTVRTSYYRDLADGTTQAGMYNIYEYSFTLNSAKTVSSITLPNNRNVEVVAATLIPASTMQVNISSSFNRIGIVSDTAPAMVGSTAAATPSRPASSERA